MPEGIPVAGSVARIGATVIAKVKSWNVDSPTNEVDVTGIEDVQAGSDLAEKKYQPTSKETKISLAGISMPGTGAAREAGQSAVKTADENGTETTLTLLDKNGYGYTYTGFFMNTKESAQTDGVIEFTADFRANTKVAVTP